MRGGPAREIPGTKHPVPGYIVRLGGEKFLVCEAARRQAEGYTLEELADWATQHRLKACRWFTENVFDRLRRGGRVSAGAAVLGTVLQIKPLLHVNQYGELAVGEKTGH